MTEPSEELKALRKRILLDFQVQRGTTAWAPWGKSGWSAVEVRQPQRKWAKVHRIKPATGERSGKTTGKVKKDRLVKRDPDLKGKDRPEFTPDAVFEFLDRIENEPPVPEPSDAGKVEWASGDDMGTWRETTEQRNARLRIGVPEVKRTPEEEAARQARITKLFDMLGEETDDDW